MVDLPQPLGPDERNEVTTLRREGNLVQDNRTVAVAFFNGVEADDGR